MVHSTHDASRAARLWSLVVWIGMYFVVLPLAGLSHVAHEAPIGRAIVYHLVFTVPLSVAFLRFQPRRRFPASSCPARAFNTRVRPSAAPRDGASRVTTRVGSRF